MRSTIGLGVFALALLLVACQSSLPQRPPGSRATVALGATSTPPAAVATAASSLPPDVDALLRRYALDQADLPAGYSTGFLSEVPNDQALDGYADPISAQKELTAVGRQGGLAEQVLPPSGVASSIGISIEVFNDAAGAQQWATNPPALPDELSPTPADPTQQIGDAISAVHWTQGAQSGYVLSFSRGRVVFGIGIAASTGQESLAPALDLALILDQKALAQSS